MEVEPQSSVHNVLRRVVADFPEVEPYIMEDGRLKQSYIIARNKEQVNREQLSLIRVEEGDEIAILPPAGGG